MTTHPLDNTLPIEAHVDPYDESYQDSINDTRVTQRLADAMDLLLESGDLTTAEYSAALKGLKLAYNAIRPAGTPNYNDWDLDIT